jgi:RimJ/RimL family protein N-acetyltransferase
MNEPILQGPGVVLRVPRETDRDDLAAAAADPLVARFVPAIPVPYTRQDAQRWIERAAAGAPDRMDFVIADPDTDRVLGAAGLHHLRWDEGTGEVGYWVAAAARGRGVAGAATRALTNWGTLRGLGRIELLTHPDNWPSQRVAMSAGYRREGVRRGGGVARGGRRYDLVVWARLADDPARPTHRVLPDLPPAATPPPAGYGGPAGALTDGVVTLRPLWTGDAADLLALRTLPEVWSTSASPVRPGRAETERRCAEAPGSWLAGLRADLTIRDAATEAFAGEIGLYYAEPVTGQAIVGYGLLPAWRGRGYATRAVRLLAGWALRDAGIARLVAGTAPDNSASQRVLERAGFVREGYQRSRLPGPSGTRVDDVLFALLPGNLHGVNPTRTPPR